MMGMEERDLSKGTVSKKPPVPGLSGRTQAKRKRKRKKKETGSSVSPGFVPGVDPDPGSRQFPPSLSAVKEPLYDARG